MRLRDVRLLLALVLSTVPWAPPAAAEEAQPPAPVLSLGGSNTVVDLRVSRDGRLLLARDSFGELRLWDLSSSMLLGRVGRAAESYRAAALSTDGRWVAAVQTASDSVNGTDSIQLFEVATGASRQLYPSPAWRPEDGEAPAPSALDFSPDGRSLTFATSIPLLDPPPDKPAAPEGYLGCAVHVLSLEAPSPTISRYVRSRPAETLPMGTVEALGYVPDGSRLVLVFQDGVARLFDPAKGAFGKEVSLGKDATLGLAASSADGRWWALTVVGDEGTAASITVWDAQTAKRSVVRVPRERTVMSLALGGGSLFAATQDAEGTARLERAPLERGGTLAAVSEVPEGLTSLASDAAGRVLVTGSERPEGGLRVREAGSGATLDEVAPGGGSPGVAFGADDGHVLMLRGGQLYEWNLSLSDSGTGGARGAFSRDVLARWRTPDDEFVQAMATDEHGRPVVLGTSSFASRLVLLREGAPPLELVAQARGPLLAPGLTADGRFAFAAMTQGADTHLSVWDASTGVRVAQAGPLGTGTMFHVAALDLREGGPRSALLVGFGANGTGIHECWDLATGKRRWSATGLALGQSLASPSGRLLATYSSTYSEASLTVADLAATSAPRKLALKQPGLDMALNDLAFVRDESAVRLLLAGGTCLEVDLAGGAVAACPERALPRPTARPRAAFHTPYQPLVSPSGRLRAEPAWGGRVDLYTADKVPLATLVLPEDPVATDAWVIFTPDGFYAANTAASRLLGMRRGTTVLPFGQFDVERNRPDLVFERLGAAPAGALARLREAHHARAAGEGAVATAAGSGPALTIDRAALPRSTAAATIAVPLLLRGADPGALRLSVSANGAPVPGPALAWVAPGSDGLRRGTLTLELVEGPNAVLVSARDAEGRSSVPERVVVVRTSRPASRRLLFLGVGVEAYADSHYALEYAADDVLALAALFRQFDGPVQVTQLLKGGSTRVEEVDRVEVEATTLTDAAATREGIVAALEALVRKAGVQDTVIVALSGHGLLDARRQCWFAPVNMDFGAPERFGLSYRDLDALLAACPHAARCC